MEWINVNDKLPSLEDCGKLFLCCLETPTNYDYVVCEWWNPLEEGQISEDKSTDPEFLFDHKPYLRTVLAYTSFDEY